MEVPAFNKGWRSPREFLVACGPRQTARVVCHSLRQTGRGGSHSDGASNAIAGGMELVVRSETAGEMEAVSFHYLIWRIRDGQSDSLELSEFSLEEPSQQISLRFRFPEPLIPFVGDSGYQGYRRERGMLYVVTEAGMLYRIKVPQPCRAIDGRISLGLGKMRQEDIQEFDIFSDIVKLDGVTAAAGSGNLLLMGGQNGSVSCFQFGMQQQGGALEAAFELKEGEGGIRRLWAGVLNRGRTISPPRDISIRHFRGFVFVFVFHEDGTVRIWDVHRRSRVHCQTLSLPDNACVNECIPLRSFFGEVDESSSELLLTVVYRNISHAEGVSAGLLGIYTWPIQTDGDVRWEDPNLKKKCPLEGKVMDVKMIKDRVWVLLEGSTGSPSVLYASLSNNQDPFKCMLEDEELAERLLLKDASTEKDLLFLEHISGSKALASRLSVSDAFCRRLLSPGVLDRSALLSTLHSYSNRLSESEVASMSSESLRAAILSSMEGQALANSLDKKDLGLWQDLCSRYLQFWRQECRPLGLLVDVKTQMAGLIRNHTFSIFRSVDQSDYLRRNQICSEAWCPHTTGAPGLSPDEMTVMGMLARCIGQLVRYIGCFGVAAFDDLLMHSDLDPNILMQEYLNLLQLGFSPSAPDSKASMGTESTFMKTKGLHSRQRSFLLTLLEDLCTAMEAVGSWGALFSLLHKCLQQVDRTAMYPSAMVHAEGCTGTIAVRVASHALRQVTKSRYIVTRNIYWLLSLLNRLSGQMDVDFEDLAMLQIGVLPKVQALIFNARVLCWLANTSAAPPMVVGNDDFSTRLSSLHIYVSGRHKLPAIRGVCEEQTIADMLLSAQAMSADKKHLRWIRSLSPDEVLGVAHRSAACIRHGCSNDQSEFTARAARLGLVFLEETQYDYLQVFLRKIHQFAEMRLPDDRDTPSLSAIEFLIGFSSLACAQTSEGSSSADTHIADSIRWFFRAAVGVETEDPLLFEILESFQNADAEMQGMALSCAKMNFYETVMQLYERYNQSEGALQFARAALQEIDFIDEDENGESAANCMQTDDEAKEEERRAADNTLKGRLWANMFKFYVDMGKHKAAYCAALSNPDTDSRNVCLRRFVVVVSEHAAGEMLCGTELPYNNLLDKVEEELRWKAENSDVHARPNPYNLLYCFHMKRHNWRRAALYMYRLGMRLEQEVVGQGSATVATLQHQAHCLAASLNALRLLDVNKAWLDVSDYEHMPDYQMPMKRLRFSPDAIIGAGQLSLSDKAYRWPLIVSISDLEKQYSLVAAKIELAQRCTSQRLPGPDATPAEVVWSLCQYGMFDTAFSLVFLFWKDSALSRQLEKIFATMTTACCRMQLQEKIKDPSGACSTVSPAAPARRRQGSASRNKNASDASPVLLLTAAGEDSPDTDMGKISFLGNNGSIGTTATCWQNLRTCLEKYAKFNPRLGVVVAETILMVDRRMQLPLWLLQHFKGSQVSRGMAGDGGDPAALLRIFLDFGLLADATALILEYLQAWARQNPINRKQPCGAWFPYTLLDRLKQQIADAVQSESGVEPARRHWSSLQANLDKALQHHLTQADADSQDVKQMAFIELNREETDNKLVVVV